MDITGRSYILTAYGSERVNSSHESVIYHLTCNRDCLSPSLLQYHPPFAHSLPCIHSKQSVTFYRGRGSERKILGLYKLTGKKLNFNFN